MTTFVVLGSRPEAEAFMRVVKASGEDVLHFSQPERDLGDDPAGRAALDALSARLASRRVVVVEYPHKAPSVRSCDRVGRAVDALHAHRFVHVSTADVLVPRAPLGNFCRDSHLVAENFYRNRWGNESDLLRVVRPGMVVGDPRLPGQRALDLLAKAPGAVPPALRRPCIAASELATATLQIALEQGTSVRTHCVLGPVVCPREGAGAEGRLAAALDALLAPVRLLLALLLWALARLWHPARAWTAPAVEPEATEDVLALCSPHNRQHVQVLGRGAVCKYYKHAFPGRLPVSMAAYSGTIKATDSSVVVKAGTTFTQLLEDLAPTGRTLLVHPNYKYITAGAAVMVPVHGSSIKHPLVNSSIIGVTYLSGGRVVRRTPAQDSDGLLSGPVAVVLEVELALNPIDTRRETYIQRVDSFRHDLRGSDLVKLLDGAVANAELRMNVPQLGQPWRLYTYTVEKAEEGSRFHLPQNWVGRLWDPILKDGKGVLARLGIERAVVASFDNYEVFLEEADFTAFADEYASKAAEWPFFKILVRKCASETFFGHGRPLYAVDIAIRHTRRNLEVSREVFARYASAQLHPSKFVGELGAHIPVMECAALRHAR